MFHQDLSHQNWFTLSTVEQMANIGSEIERAIKWSGKNADYARLANFRALELFDLTLVDPKHSSGLKEIARARELWLDYFIGQNQYSQTADQWHKYFYSFTYAAQNCKNL